LLRGNETLEYLAEQASKGDEECFVMICRTLEKKLFRTAKGVLGNETLSLDAVSVFIFLPTQAWAENKINTLKSEA